MTECDSNGNQISGPTQVQFGNSTIAWSWENDGSVLSLNRIDGSVSLKDANGNAEVMPFSGCRVVKDIKK